MHKNVKNVNMESKKEIPHLRYQRLGNDKSYTCEGNQLQKNVLLEEKIEAIMKNKKQRGIRRRREERRLPAKRGRVKRDGAAHEGEDIRFSVFMFFNWVG